MPYSEVSQRGIFLSIIDKKIFTFCTMHAGNIVRFHVYRGIFVTSVYIDKEIFTFCTMNAGSIVKFHKEGIFCHQNYRQGSICILHNACWEYSEVSCIGSFVTRQGNMFLK